MECYLLECYLLEYYLLVCYLLKLALQSDLQSSLRSLDWALEGPKVSYHLVGFRSGDVLDTFRDNLQVVFNCHSTNQ